MSQTGPHAIRGFSTVQLLQLAGIAVANFIFRHPALHPTKTTKGVTKQVKLNNSNDVYAILNAWLGNALPGAKVRGYNFIKSLASAKSGLKWFKAASAGKDAFAPLSVEGQQVNAQRAVIYSFLTRQLAPFQAKGQQINPVHARMLDYVMDVKSYDQTTRPGTKGQSPIKQDDAGTKLARVLKSSFSWHGEGQPAPAKGTKYSLQDYITATNLVWAQSSSNQEPEGLKRAGNAVVGRERPASVQQAQERINQTNGFLSNKILAYLLSRYEDPNLYETATARRPADTPEQLAARREYVAAFSRVMLTTPQLQAAKKTEVRRYFEALYAANQVSPAQMASFFKTIVDSLGGLAAGKQKLWLIGNEGKIKDLLAGNDILQPGSGETRGWVWARDAVQGGDPNNQVAFTKAVYEGLFDKYYAQGGNGDRLSQRAATRAATIAAGGGVKPKGILGTDDKSFEDLKQENPVQVAKFISKVRKGQFSMNALQRGAEMLGIPVDKGAVLHDAVIGLLLDGVVRLYGPKVDDASLTAAQKAPYVLAVGAAVGIQAAADMSPVSIRRKIDAKYGIISDACSDANGKPVNYTIEDLKRISKGLGLTVSQQADHASLCAAINAALQAKQGGQRDAPTQSTSGRRSERATARVSSGRGGGAGRSVAVSSGPFGDLLKGVREAAQPSNLAQLAQTNGVFGGSQVPAQQPQMPLNSPTTPRSRLARLGQQAPVLVGPAGEVVRGTSAQPAGVPAAGVAPLPSVFQPPAGFAASPNNGGVFLSPGRNNQFSPGSGQVRPFGGGGLI